MFDLSLNMNSSSAGIPLPSLANTSQSAGGSIYQMGIYADKALAGILVEPESVLIRQLGENVVVIKPIPVEIHREAGSFVASFNAANAHASGDTWNEALVNLQFWIIDLFNNLTSHKPEILGPAPKRQLAVLQSYLGR